MIIEADILIIQQVHIRNIIRCCIDQSFDVVGCVRKGFQCIILAGLKDFLPVLIMVKMLVD